jgi:hypothetical protein
MTLCSVLVGLIVFTKSAALIERHGAKTLLLVAHAGTHALPILSLSSDLLSEINSGHALRLTLYMFVTRDNCLVALPLIEALHCFSFALFWCAGAHMLHAVVCTDQILVSNQSLLALSHTTFGQLLGGFLFLQVQVFPPSLLFLGFAVVESRAAKR